MLGSVELNYKPELSISQPCVIAYVRHCPLRIFFVYTGGSFWGAAMNQFDVVKAALASEISAERASIDADRQGLDVRERALDVKVQALDALNRYGSGLPAHTATVARVPPVQTSASHEEIDLSDLVTDESSRRKTFNDDVRDVVRRFGGQEFTNAHAEAAMKKLGIEIVGKTPRSRISLAFAKLVEDGFLIRTFIGGGNVPHRYKLRSAVPAGEAAQIDEMNRAHAEPEESQTTLDDQDQPSTENVVRIA
jgi:hypothetical protein